MSYALISVFDKTGIIPLAKTLAERNIRILSTGGTAKTLRAAGLKIIDVSDFTGQKEILGGRVKTLHPKIFGGILTMPAEIKYVIVNLYPFEKTLEKEGTGEEELIEKIDIGGVSLIRAAAKNFQYVTAVCDPSDYRRVGNFLKKDGAVPVEERRRLARKAFELTTNYDETISGWFRQALGEPELLKLHYEKVRKLRYGENPQQKAAFFRNPYNHDPNVTNAKVLQGKELSFNNILDANSALELVKEFEKPTVVFVKHNNPCGVASAKTIEKAFALSFEVDPLSAFGAVVAINRNCTAKIAEFILKKKIFLELIICPKFEPGALKLLGQKQNLRLLETGKLTLDKEKRDLKKVTGGLLVQTGDTAVVAEKDLTVVTKKKPTKEQIRAMLFANKIVKYVMSNAIIFAKSKGDVDVVTGIGAGQMSRVDSVFIATHKGGKRVSGSVMSSDAFFPFPDAVELAAKAKISAIIQPGGSIRDAEVIACADKHKMAMVCSGVRFFRH